MIQPLQALWKQLPHQSTLNCCYVGKGNTLEHYESWQQLYDFSQVIKDQSSFLFAGNGKELSSDCTLRCIFVVLDIWNPYLYSTELTRECEFFFYFSWKDGKKKPKWQLTESILWFVITGSFYTLVVQVCIVVDFYSPKGFLC